MFCSIGSCNALISSHSKSGLCKKHYCYQWKSENKEKTAQHSKTSYLRNRRHYIESSSAYRSKSRHTNPMIKLRDSLRRRLNNALKNNQKTGSAIDDLGCSIAQLKIHLEVRFQPGMTWNNYGSWHIDHIKPLGSFDLNNRVELLKACHYTNLQPLWATDNLIKGSRYEV